MNDVEGMLAPDELANVLFGPSILMTVFFVIYTAVFVQAMNRSRVKSRPSNIFAAHRDRIIRGSPMSLSNLMLYFASVSMWGLTFASLVCRWCLAVRRGSFLPEIKVAQSTLALVIFLADAILTWRCWAVFHCNIWVILVPILGMAAEVGLFLWNVSEGTPLALIAGGFFPAISLIATLYCTVAIGIRLVWQRRRGPGRTTGESTTSLRGVLEVIIETAVLYSVTLIVHVIVVWGIRGVGGTYYTEAIIICIAGMCPTWILTQVVNDRTPEHADAVDLFDGESVHTPTQMQYTSEPWEKDGIISRLEAVRLDSWRDSSQFDYVHRP
ncbi:hypothetical protein CYLTODRAFT_427132 [Cylindrobasidium torrendii FP15055 ss-10]|uniref:Uncharacterized protein n=1 Tax=Cylindrobasidium torrendii FP15055 ss-10 TaxID=1314674 RepID=A0A0D7AUT0_9AGAR|nr:hypothetical protein CYLTODRAFT_427132 [Cylindrobasidium torrendii FP15055 ss-10]